MSEVREVDTVEQKVGQRVTFMAYMCENRPSFSDIDTAAALMPHQGVAHRQREIWKWAPKRDKEQKVAYEDDKKMVMVKVVTRNSKMVTVKGDGRGGLVSILGNGNIEPMDYKDVKEVIELLTK